MHGVLLIKIPYTWRTNEFTRQARVPARGTPTHCHHHNPWFMRVEAGKPGGLSPLAGTLVFYPRYEQRIMITLHHKVSSHIQNRSTPSTTAHTAPPVDRLWTVLARPGHKQPFAISHANYWHQCTNQSVYVLWAAYKHFLSISQETKNVTYNTIARRLYHVCT